MHSSEPPRCAISGNREPSFDHFVGAFENRRWHVEPESLRRFEMITSSNLLGALGPRLGLWIERREKRLRLLDLGEFLCRRKALERRRQHGVAVAGAVRALIVLRERKRRAQLEAARLLMLRNGDGAKERLFDRRNALPISLEQNLAADTVHFSVEPAFPGALGLDERVIQARERGIDLAAIGFKRGERGEKLRIKEQNSLITQRFHPLSHFGDSSLALA